MAEAMVVTHKDGSREVVPVVEGVWEHPCGSQMFWLNDDGTISCSHCGDTLSSFVWTRGSTQ